MSGPGYGKKPLKLKVYIHEKGKSLARITHIDLEGDEISEVIRPGEVTFIRGKPGGAFIALKKEMIARAERILKRKKKKK